MAKDFTVTAILGEEVRPELGNKHSILGIYTGDVLLPEFPANIRLSFYIVFKFIRAGEHKIELRILLDNKVITSGVTELTSNEGDPAVLVSPSGILGVDSPSELKIDASVDGGRRTTLVKKQIRLAVL